MLLNLLAGKPVASTLLCLLVGLPGAALFARYRFRGKRLLWSALLVPFVLPTVVVGVAMLGVYGPGGVSGLTLSGTIWAILIAHVFFNYAVVVRTVGSAWATIGPSGEDAARMLGCPEGTVKSRCFRGRAKLAKRLDFLRNLDQTGPVTTAEGGEPEHG